MSSIIYKRLFEIRVLHDFYIMEAYKRWQQVSFFHGSTNQSTVLNKVLKLEQYKVSDYFEIKPLESTKELLERYKIRFIRNPLGFFLGMEVKQTIIPGGGGGSERTYQPSISPPETLHFQFLINSIDPDINKKTILPAPGPLNAKFYFSNINSSGNKTYPALSENTADVTDGTVNETDVNFLPFRLTIATEIGNTINITLAKPNGTIIIEKEKLATTDTLSINLQQPNSYIVDQPPIPDGLYDLTLDLGDGSGPTINRYFFSEQVFRESNFGVLDIFFDAQDQDTHYDLMENQTDLKTKLTITLDGDGNEVWDFSGLPSFELRLKGILPPPPPP